jgi:hypothetical protein
MSDRAKTPTPGENITVAVKTPSGHIKRAEAPARGPDATDPYGQAIEGQTANMTKRQARSRYDAELCNALSKPDAHALVEATRSQLERSFEKADRALDDAPLSQARSSVQPDR